MTLRRYLQDFDKEDLTALELFLAEEEFTCPTSSVIDIDENELPPDETVEEDEIIVEVITAPPPEELDWSGFVFFSDVHSCTPVGDAQQSVQVRLVDFVFCDEPECGGPGGWLTWFTNDPEATPESPENPLLPYH